MSWSERFQARGSALCVGLDPVAERLPPGVDAGAFLAGVIDATHDCAACYKPNLAFFERRGWWDELGAVLALLRREGLPVVVDGKRGDVAQTAEAYAGAYFGGPYDCDALTVNPALGLDAVEPFRRAARERDRGVFLLLRTSNAGAAQFQGPMEPALVAAIRGEPAFGAVVGATQPEAAARLRAALPGALFLVPGFGAQGGTAIAPCFEAGGRGAIVNSSREILYAGEGRENWKDAVRDAALAAFRAIEKARGR